MPTVDVVLVLIAAAAHAVWNTVSKYKRGDTEVFVWAYTCLSTVVCAPFAVLAIYSGGPGPGWALVGGACVSAAFHTVYSLSLQGGYDRFDLGVVYPVARGTGPVLTMVFAIVVIGERPGALTVVGAGVVVAGIIVVTGNPLRGSSTRHRAALWGAATGVAIAAYTLWDDFSVTSLHLEPVTYFTGSCLVQSLVMTPRVLGRRHLVRATVTENVAPIVTVATFSPLAYILVLTALQSAPVALVAPLRESSIVIGSLLAWRLFNEGHLARRLAGAAIVLAGIAAISL